jgi:hypothetical protein
MGKITHVFVGCHQGDQILARICVASVRYWYPDIPIYLVKDEGTEPFSTDEMERHWRVSVLPQDSARARGLMNKFRMLFCPLRGRGLYIDSDIVLLGRVLQTLEAHDEDFLIAGERAADLSGRDIESWYYDWIALQRLDPSFRFPEFCFNAGQYAWTLGAVTAQDFDGIVSRTDEVRLLRPDVFRCGDQGALNYVVQKKVQEGRLRLGRPDFAKWIHDPVSATYRIDKIREGVGYPLLLHWAGGKPFSISRMPRADLLRFYEDFYYSRIPFAPPKRFGRALKANTLGAWSSLRKVLHRWKSRIFPGQH